MSDTLMLIDDDKDQLEIKEVYGFGEPMTAMFINDEDGMASINLNWERAAKLHEWLGNFLALTLTTTSQDELAKLQAAIRKHRDQRGDDRCWLDDRDLYDMLPEGYTPPKEDMLVELERCKKFITCRHDPATSYVSPQRKIEELEAEIAKLKSQLQEEKEYSRRLIAENGLGD